MFNFSSSYAILSVDSSGLGIGKLYRIATLLYYHYSIYMEK